MHKTGGVSSNQNLLVAPPFIIQLLPSMAINGGTLTQRLFACREAAEFTAPHALANAAVGQHLGQPVSRVGCIPDFDFQR